MSKDTDFCDTVDMIARALKDFYLEYGYLIVENILPVVRLEEVRDALEERYMLEGNQAGSEGSINPGVRRLCNLFSKGRVWEEIAVEPMVLEMAKLTIGDDIRWQAMNFHDPVPGESEAHQAIHVDRWFFPNCTRYLNACWVIDDMTMENGATRIVPGSHKGPWPRDVLDDKGTRAVIDGEIYTECAAGSVVFCHGDVWHGGRANYSQSTRRVIHMGFACPNTAPQYEIAGALSSEIRERLGDHCALIPGTLESFGLSESWYAGKVSRVVLANDNKEL